MAKRKNTLRKNTRRNSRRVNKKNTLKNTKRNSKRKNTRRVRNINNVKKNNSKKKVISKKYKRGGSTGSTGAPVIKSEGELRDDAIAAYNQKILLTDEVEPMSLYQYIDFLIEWKGYLLPTHLSYIKTMIESEIESDVLRLITQLETGGLEGAAMYDELIQTYNELVEILLTSLNRGADQNMTDIVELLQSGMARFILSKKPVSQAPSMPPPEVKKSATPSPALRKVVAPPAFLTTTADADDPDEVPDTQQDEQDDIERMEKAKRLIRSIRERALDTKPQPEIAFHPGHHPFNYKNFNVVGPALVDAETGKVNMEEFYGEKYHGENLFIHDPLEGGDGYGNAPVNQNGYSFVAIIPQGFEDGFGVPTGKGTGGAFVGFVYATASDDDKTIIVEFANGNRVAVDLTLLGKYSTGEMLNIKCVRLKEGVSSPVSPLKEEPPATPRQPQYVGPGKWGLDPSSEKTGSTSRLGVSCYNLGKNKRGNYDIIWWNPYAHPSDGVRAKVYDDTTRTAADMTLSKGEIVVVTKKLNDDWWEGYVEGNEEQKGIFHRSIVIELPLGEPWDSERMMELVEDTFKKDLNDLKKHLNYNKNGEEINPPPLIHDEITKEDIENGKWLPQYVGPGRWDVRASLSGIKHAGASGYNLGKNNSGKYDIIWWNPEAIAAQASGNGVLGTPWGSRRMMKLVVKYGDINNLKKHFNNKVVGVRGRRKVLEEIIPNPIIHEQITERDITKGKWIPF